MQLLARFMEGVQSARDVAGQTVGMSFGAIASAFLQESVGRMIPWLIATAAVILCDLVAAMRRCVMTGEKVRLSRAVRQTMGKMVTYYSFIIMVCMIDVAAGGGTRIEKVACIVVCAVELYSILSNILKPKNIFIDCTRLLGALSGKLFGMNMDGVFVKGEDRKKD